jgi:hypothetical protein
MTSKKYVTSSFAIEVLGQVKRFGAKVPIRGTVSHVHTQQDSLSSSILSVALQPSDTKRR